jgi:Domain of unknown function (DUF932)
MNLNNITSISLDAAKSIAPAIFATSPAPTIKSPKYQFTPTFEVIEHMQDMGYVLTGVKQSKSNVELRKNWGIHITRFQHPDLYIKDPQGMIEARPEVVLINSHDGTRPIQFEMGLFRLVCENGLVIKDRDMGSFRERHTKLNFQEVKNLMDQKVSGLQEVVGKISQWNMKEMTDKQRFNFAMDALALRIGTDRQAEQYEIMDILTAKRKVDEQPTLWHTFNTVQENLIKGGFQLNNRQARAINNPVEDFNINQGLWQLADSYLN